MRLIIQRQSIRRPWYLIQSREGEFTILLIHAMPPFYCTVLAQAGRSSCERLRRVSIMTAKQGRESSLENWTEHGRAGISNGKSRLCNTPEGSPDHRVRQIGEINRGEDTDTDDGDGGNTMILVRTLLCDGEPGGRRKLTRHPIQRSQPIPS